MGACAEKGESPSGLVQRFFFVFCSRPGRRSWKNISFRGGDYLSPERVRTSCRCNAPLLLCFAPAPGPFLSAESFAGFLEGAWCACHFFAIFRKRFRARSRKLWAMDLRIFSSNSFSSLLVCPGCLKYPSPPFLFLFYLIVVFF